MVKSIPQVKADLNEQLHALRRQLGSPSSGAHHVVGTPPSGADDIKGKIDDLEKQLVKLSRFSDKTPTAHMPRGMIARISLRMVGGSAVHYASDVMCRGPDCTVVENLAALQSDHTHPGGIGWSLPVGARVVPGRCSVGARSVNA